MLIVNAILILFNRACHVQQLSYQYVSEAGDGCYFPMLYNDVFEYQLFVMIKVENHVPQISIL